MNLSPRDANDVLTVLRFGPVSGAVLGLGNAFTGLVESLTKAAADLQFRDASEYEVKTYVVYDHGSRRGAVVKIAPYRHQHLARGIAREFVLLRELRQSTCSSFRVPDGEALFVVDNHLVSVVEMLNGTYLTERNVTAYDVVAAAHAIGTLETALVRTGIGTSLTTEARGPYYAKKAHQFIERVLPGVWFSDAMESDFTALETVRTAHPVVVSDRSPANIILDASGAVGMFDFGLLLVGTPFEDWSWFIDDPRLRTEIPRMELVRIFAGAAGMHFDHSAEMMFHRAAMFVNIKQCCIAAGTGRGGVGHYLSRLRQSAKALSSDRAMRLVESLQILAPPEP